MPEQERGSGFFRSLALVWRFAARKGADLTTLASLSFTNRNRAESTITKNRGEAYEQKRAGRQAAEACAEDRGLEGIGDRAPGCSRHRCRGQRTLGSGEPGAGCRTRAALRMLHGRGAGDGRMAGGEGRAKRGDAVHRRVLDAGIRSTGAARAGSVSGKRAAHEEPAGTQKRCPGVPVVVEAACLRAAEQQFSADR